MHPPELPPARLLHTRLRQHGGELQLRKGARPLQNEPLLVEILVPARAPIEINLPLDAAFEHMTQHRLQRCKAGAARDEYEGRATWPIDELADGALDAQQRAGPQLLEESLCEAATWNVARVQLD